MRLMREHRINVNTVIGADVQVVWNEVRHLDRHIEWMNDAHEIRFTSECTEGVGTTFVCDTRIGPIRMVDRMEITSWVPGREIGVKHAGAVQGSGSFVLEPIGVDRTLFRWTESLRFPWWLGGSIGGWVGARILARVWLHNLDTFAARFTEPDPVLVQSGDTATSTKSGEAVPLNDTVQTQTEPGGISGDPVSSDPRQHRPDRTEPSEIGGDPVSSDPRQHRPDRTEPGGISGDPVSSDPRQHRPDRTEPSEIGGDPVSSDPRQHRPDRTEPGEQCTVAIEQHMMLSDQRTVALVAPGARINWMCLPNIDSLAVFAELLGGPTAGYFLVEPCDPAVSMRGDTALGMRGDPAVGRYLDDSMVVHTEWANMTVTDYLDCSDGAPIDPNAPRCLVRTISGTGCARIEFAPRLDFGRSPTLLNQSIDGLDVLNSAITLRSPGLNWQIETIGPHQTAVAIVDLGDGPVTVELCHTRSSQVPDPGLRGGSARRIDLESTRLDQTVRFWSDWADRLDLPLVEPELVKRSALTLKALCHGPTGAMAAAATTSLPESIGGVRNWDYRFCWIRDASMAAAALVRLGSINEAIEFLDWLVRLAQTSDSVAGAPETRETPTSDLLGAGLAPLYTVDGRSLPPETKINELCGYAGSTPVRVGNAADRQIQIDIYGYVVELVHLLTLRRAPLKTSHLELVESLINTVQRTWQEPDQGMWEVRCEPRHHINSKVMCWVAADRGVRIAADAYGQKHPEYETLRDLIRDDILANSTDSQAFTTAYDGDDIDASVLAVGLYGLIDGDDDRFAATVDAVESVLRVDDTVYRYKHTDGVVGTEGGFNLMTSWLIDAKCVMGDTTGASKLFEAHLQLVGPGGLMSEEVDPVTGTALGNFPQAYSHLGLINNALNLAAGLRS